ncbi:MAG: hypothetical protein ACI87W_003000 [Halieaceae bacterium]|jgi:hypothetical protein
MTPHDRSLPAVAFWRICMLRFFFYLLTAVVISTFVWQQLLFESEQWPAVRGIAKSMIGAVGLLCFIGVFHPLKMLPLMIFEILWKTLWLGIIALPAWLNDRWTDGIDSVFFDCIGVFVVYAVIPWRYVWARFVKQSYEPWSYGAHIASEKK